MQLLLILTLALPAAANPVSIIDLTHSRAARDGVVGPGEYAGCGDGRGGSFGTIIGFGVQLCADSDYDGGFIFGLTAGAVPLNTDAIVIYIDSMPGSGFDSTLFLNDVADPVRVAISGGVGQTDLIFAPGFL